MDRHDKDFLALLLLAVVFTAGGLNGMRVGMSDWSWLLAAAGLFIGAYAYVKWQAARRVTPSDRTGAASPRTHDEPPQR